MPTTSINDNNIAPIKQDLFGDDQALEVIRGLVEMKRIDQPLVSGIDLGKGEWGVLGTDGNITRATSTPAAASYVCFAGTDRYDVRATGQVTLIMNSPIVAKTTYFDTTATLASGDSLTAKLLASGTAAGKCGLAKASGSDPVHAYCYSVSGGYLTFSVVPR